MTFSQAAFADRINLLIMAEDWDTESVPRDNRIDRSIIARLSEVAQNQSIRLSDRFDQFDGFRVYDETAVTYQNFTSGDRRSDELLIDIAKNIDSASIDVLVLYTVFAQQDFGPGKASLKLQLEVLMRAIDVRSGLTLARVSEFGTSDVLPRDCMPGQSSEDELRSCVIREVAKTLRDFSGDEFSALLEDAVKESYDLGRSTTTYTADNGELCGRSERYVIEMRDFSARELMRFEEEASEWDCVEELELRNASNTISEYFLYTGRPENWVKRDVAGALAVMGLQGRIKVGSDGTITVKWDGAL
jgi:hypothetical protein